jgi:hypothetical protein
MGATSARRPKRRKLTRRIESFAKSGIECGEKFARTSATYFDLLALDLMGDVCPSWETFKADWTNQLATDPVFRNEAFRACFILGAQSVFEELKNKTCRAWLICEGRE